MKGSNQTKTDQQNSLIIIPKMNVKEIILVSIIVVLCLLYFFLATFPKHGDFWIMSYTAKCFAEGHHDFYDYILKCGKKSRSYVAYPPLFYIIQGAWFKFLSMLSLIDLDKFTTNRSHVLPFALFPHLFSLFLAVYLTYKNVKNKFLSLLWFGTLSFVSLEVMGQIDIFCSLFLLISIILAVKASSLNDKRLWILSFAFMGLSMCFKPYTAMLIPMYLLFLASKTRPYLPAFYMIVVCILVLILVFLIPWIPFWSHFNEIVLGKSVIASESTWLLKMQIVSPVKQQFTISIWLFGYLALIYYFLFSLKNYHNFRDDLFLFFVFATISWFFATSYTHPQWHIILLPPLILLIDRVWNLKMLFFCVVHQIVFLFFSMRYSTWEILNFYIPATPIRGDLSTIVCTLLSFVLIFWCVEIWIELKANAGRN